MVPILEPQDLQDRGTITSRLERRTPRAHNRHCKTLPCVVWCQMAPLYGAAEMADTLCTMRSSGLGHRCDLNSPKTSHQKYTNKGLKNPVEGFLASEGSTWLIFGNSATLRPPMPSSEPALNRCCGFEPPSMWS